MPFFLLHPALCCSQGFAECQRGTGQGVKAGQMEPEHKSVSQYVYLQRQKGKSLLFLFPECLSAGGKWVLMNFVVMLTKLLQCFLQGFGSENCHLKLGQNE